MAKTLLICHYGHTEFYTRGRGWQGTGRYLNLTKVRMNSMFVAASGTNMFVAGNVH